MGSNRIMKYTPMNIAGWNILKVEVLDAPEVIELAEKRAIRKSPKVKKGDSGGKIRTHNEIFSQNFLGALADIACTKLLGSYFKEHSIPIFVESYDQVRTDNFKDADLFDIRLTSATVQSIVEVRSSVCNLLPLENLINKWHILGPYYSEAKGGLETLKDYYIRPMYHLNRFEENKRTKFYRKANGMQLLKSGDIDLYIFGGATAAILSSDKAKDENGETLKQGKSSFKVVDIKDGLEPKEFLEAIVHEMVAN